MSSYPNGNTTDLNPFFSGTASVDNSTLTGVEYSTDEGSTWIQIAPSDGNYDSSNESFSFNLSNLIPRSYNVLIRAVSQAGVYTDSSSYANISFTIIAAPPVIIVNTITPNPTKNQTPQITGSVSSKFLTITKVEISLDAGTSWTPVKFASGRFTFTPEPLTDDNYTIVARATDSNENVSTSNPQTLVVDNLPPIIGGATLSLGPEILTPDANDTINVIQNADVNIAMGMKGGVIKASVLANGINYELSRKEGTDIWTGIIGFKNEGSTQIKVDAVDGAGNTAEKIFGNIVVQKTGNIKAKSNGKSIDKAVVKIYFYENTTKSWMLWDGTTYGQENPQITDISGTYSFMVPDGKYYIEVSAPRFYTTDSQILSFNNLSLVNPDFTLGPKPALTFTLPLLGKITLTIPDIFPPDTNQVQTTQTARQTIINNSKLINKPAPNFNLPNIKGENTSLSSYLGKKLVLTYITPWSTESVEQAGVLSGNSSAIIIMLQESLAATQSFVNSGDYNFTILTDVNGLSANDYDVTYLPKTYFIDTKGIIRKIDTGIQSKEEITQALNNMQ